MIDQEVERILGDIQQDNPEGRWLPNRGKDGFVRFYSTGIRELIHKHEEQWTVSIAYHQFFELGRERFDTTREAKHYADNRDFDALYWLEEDANRIRRKHNELSARPSPEQDSGDIGF